VGEKKKNKDKGETVKWKLIFKIGKNEICKSQKGAEE
jgi:hypothetical protein